MRDAAEPAVGGVGAGWWAGWVDVGEPGRGRAYAVAAAGVAGAAGDARGAGVGGDAVAWSGRAEMRQVWATVCACVS